VAITPGVRVDAAYTLTDARFSDYVTRSGDFAGNRVPGIAPHRVELGTTLEGGRGWFLTLEGRHLSSIPVDDANSARSPAHTLLDARGGHTAIPAGRASVAPFVGVTNLLGSRYNAAVAVNAFGQRFFEPGPGRSIYLGAALRL
jgi:iron complex outermembrane recepter protein